MTNLEVLDVELCEDVRDAGLVHLRGLTGLRELNLRGTRVTDAGLVHLKALTGAVRCYDPLGVATASLAQEARAAMTVYALDPNRSDPGILTVLIWRTVGRGRLFGRIKELNLKTSYVTHATA